MQTLPCGSLYKPLEVHTHIWLCLFVLCVWILSFAIMCMLLTGIVRLPCKLLMAAWASACPWNFTNAHPVTNSHWIKNKNGTAWNEALCGIIFECILPLLVPSGPLKTVHSSMLPKGSNSLLTSSSLCCFPSMPTNNFLSSERPRMCGGKGRKCYEFNVIFPMLATWLV